MRDFMDEYLPLGLYRRDGCNARTRQYAPDDSRRAAGVRKNPSFIGGLLAGSLLESRPCLWTDAGYRRKPEHQEYLRLCLRGLHGLSGA